MRNFARINNYYNNIECWRDWKRLATEVESAGFGDLVEKHHPPDGAKWRTVDKCIAALRAEFQAVQQHETISGTAGERC